METTENSINRNGCSVCKAGEEKYIKCVLGAFLGKIYYQYDYRHRDGELFSTLQETLELCREKRDKWVQAKNCKRLFPSMVKKIADGKRLTKSDMGCEIGQVDPLHPASLYWDYYKRDEIVEMFNQMFGTEIK
jgi:hypothetical protein